MHWIAPSEIDAFTATLGKRLLDAANQFRANTGLNVHECLDAMLGLICLRFAEVQFATQPGKLMKTGSSSRRGSRLDEPTSYHNQWIRIMELEMVSHWDQPRYEITEMV